MNRFQVFVLVTAVYTLLSGCASTTDKDVISLYQLAESQYEKGLLSQAEANYRKVVQQSPDVSDAWLRLGNIHVRTGFLSAGIDMYNKCIEIEPEDTRCWNNLAITRIKQGIKVLDTARSGGYIKNKNDLEILDNIYWKMVTVITEGPDGQAKEIFAQ